MYTLKLIRVKNMQDEEKKENIIKNMRIKQKQLDKVDVNGKDALHQTLSIAYYNIAVEYEHIMNLDSAILAFLKAQFFAKLSKGENRFQFIE